MASRLRQDSAPERLDSDDMANTGRLDQNLDPPFSRNPPFEPVGSDVFLRQPVHAMVRLVALDELDGTTVDHDPVVGIVRVRAGQ